MLQCGNPSSTRNGTYTQVHTTHFFYVPSYVCMLELYSAKALDRNVGVP